ncbi:MAG: flagellar biosynthesis protein FlgM [Acidobacteria bacterium]|nr:flagellar biosynthesis protein FlgM [Acidobacteriota bacterium]
MRWKQGRRSRNIDDRRGAARVRRGPVLGGGMGLLLIVVVLLMGGDPTQILMLLADGGAQPADAGRAAAPPTAADNEAADFVSVVLGTTEDAWGQVFSSAGQTYPPPTLVLYRDAVQSACGFNSAATGPFYCPGDQQIYIDLGFIDELRRLGAPGDFAFAYVIAHEVGHHIQRITGIEPQVRDAQRSVGELESNRLSVLMELQADCYAGLWANHAERAGLLETGDIDEGLAAAAAVGDDRLQRQAGRAVQPESFTHGTSAQRMEWFTRGLRDASVARCDTFGR